MALIQYQVSRLIVALQETLDIITFVEAAVHRSKKADTDHAFLETKPPCSPRSAARRL